MVELVSTVDAQETEWVSSGEISVTTFPRIEMIGTADDLASNPAQGHFRNKTEHAKIKRFRETGWTRTCIWSAVGSDSRHGRSWKIR